MGVLTSDGKFERFITELLEKFSEMPQNNDDDTIDFIFRTMDHRTHILSTGLYYYHLLRWFQVYKRSEIHIVDGEELLTDPGSVLEKVQQFLEIPKLIIKEDFVRDSSGFFCMNAPEAILAGAEFKLERRQHPECIPRHSKGRTRMGRWQYKPSEALIQSLKRFFAPHNQKLYDLIGKKFDWHLLNS